ncbi:MAG: hypothetical protein HY820_33035 [Acidobacteria bacterium]|nr:hypothetical protein [Acidobacteriota bacterium]
MVLHLVGETIDKTRSHYAAETGGPQSNDSSINSPAGRILANSVILRFVLLSCDEGRMSDTQSGAFGGIWGGPMYEPETSRMLPVPTSPR